MSLPIGLEDAAERLIEFTMTRNKVGFSTDLSPANLTNMAMLDVDALESDDHKAGFFSSPDWNSALVSIADDIAKEARLTSLLQALAQGDESAKVCCKSIETIFEKEFEPSSGITENYWRGVNIVQKAAIIAKQRAKRNLVILPRPADYEHNRANYEFKVALLMLYGGNGRHHGATKLTFSYNTPFHSFLRTLEDCTQLCIIPPLKTGQILSTVKKTSPTSVKVTLDPVTPPPKQAQNPSSTSPKVTIDLVTPPPKQAQKPSSTSPKVALGPVTPPPKHAPKTMEQGGKKLFSLSTSKTAFMDMDDQSSSSDYSPSVRVRRKVKTSRKVKAPQKFKALKRSSAPKALESDKDSELHNCKDRGYTLDHGPWSYRIVDQKNPPPGRLWERLGSIDDYMEMMKAVKPCIVAKENVVVTVMHSLDVEAYEECNAQKLRESFEERENEIPPGWDETLDDVDDDSEGEPYLQWLSRTLGQQRRVAS